MLLYGRERTFDPLERALVEERLTYLQATGFMCVASQPDHRLRATMR
jgi:hypothetical protein